MSKETLRSGYDHLFRQAHTTEDWITPLLKAVDSTTYEEARFSPGPGVASIWEIVAHVTGWLEDLLHDLTGSPEPGRIDWPPVLDRTESGWHSVQSYLRTLVTTLHSHLKPLSEEELLTPPPGLETSRLKRIVNIVVHDAYHAGQIVKLRQLFQSQAKSGELIAAGIPVP